MNRKSLQLRFEGVDLHFHELSDGERALLALYMIRAALDTNSGCTVLLDEPDNFVGLSELQPWVLSLRELLDENHQALLSSHHPEILSQAGEESGILLWRDSNLARFVPCGGRTELIQRMPRELRACIQSGAETTLVVCADVDHDTPDCDALREKFRGEALSAGISDSVRQMSPGKDHAFPTIEWSCRNWRRLVETMRDNV